MFDCCRLEPSLLAGADVVGCVDCLDVTSFSFWSLTTGSETLSELEVASADRSEAWVSDRAEVSAGDIAGLSHTHSHQQFILQIISIFHYF